MKNFTYKSFFKNCFCLFCYFVLNNVISGVPFSVALLPAFMAISSFPLIQAILFLIACIINFNLFQCALLFITAVIFVIIMSVYKAKRKTVGIELLAFTLISLIPYFLGEFSHSIYQKLVYSAIIYALAVIFSIGAKMAFVKKFRTKSMLYERIALYASAVAISLGMINILGSGIWQAIAVTIVLFTCAFYKDTRAFIPACVLAFAICLHTKNLSSLSLFVIYCAACLLFINTSSLLSAFSVALIQFAYHYLNGVLPYFTPYNYLETFLPTVIFLFTPKKLFDSLQKLLLKFDLPQITRQIINIERGEISARLNSLSSSFSDLENAISCFDNLYMTSEQMADKIAEEIVFTVCSSCRMQSECLKKNKPDKGDILKLITLGLNKGKVTLIDLSRDFSSYCYSVNSMIYEINKQISTYEEFIEKSKQTKTYKNLILLQADGISEVLSSIALEFSSRIDFKQKNEKLIFDQLAFSGILAKQIICAGEDFHILLGREKIDSAIISECIFLATGKRVQLTSKTDVGEGILAVFKNAPLLDASFGIAQRTKDASDASGDTHSLIRINEGTFIVSLCDGMGSGSAAYNNSKAAISLLEGFFKAGISGRKALEIVNKLLSVCSSDSFSTLDGGVFDLYGGFLNVVKIGASYGFLIGSDKITVIENASLPLGILEEVTPTTQTLKIEGGDMLVMLSDGITDAFFSSTDTVDFLATQTTKNPQILADRILQRAIELNDGEAIDDMTAIV
ncbi:MAG: SpoIIE family protein phosphatase, partial [Clostridia bacterium]|nr:SpoIIE family protein phosphatase [Clostridia bacterium]